MRATKSVALVALLVAGGSSACGRSYQGSHGADASAGNGASADLRASADAATAQDVRATAQSIPCRAIAVQGPVRSDIDGGAEARPDSLAVRGEIPADAWLTLGPGARLVAKDPRTTRETAFAGPARVRPCVAHREESWIGSGRFESAVGAGETPGAEEWVVTPLAVVRYMAAQVRVEVRATETSVELGTGSAYLSLAEETRTSPAPTRRPPDAGAPATTTLDDDGWLRMSPGMLVLAPANSAKPATASPIGAARVMVDRCVALSEQARGLASELLAGMSTLDGGVARDQLRTRRLARAACAIAAVRVGELPRSSGSSGSLASIAEAELARHLQAATPTATASMAEPTAATAAPSGTSRVAP